MERDEHMDRHVLSGYALEQGLLMNFVFKREALFKPEQYQEWLGRSEFKDRCVLDFGEVHLSIIRFGNFESGLQFNRDHEVVYEIAIMDAKTGALIDHEATGNHQLYGDGEVRTGLTFKDLECIVLELMHVYKLERTPRILDGLG